MIVLVWRELEAAGFMHYIIIDSRLRAGEMIGWFG